MIPANVHATVEPQLTSQMNQLHLNPPSVCIARKGKKAYLYSAFYMLCISQNAQAWITQFYLQIHNGMLFLRKRSPDGATFNQGSRHPVAAYSAYYSSIDPDGIKG